MATSYKHPVYVHFEPNELTDADREIVADYFKNTMQACVLAEESMPITGKNFLHGGGVSSKKATEVTTDLHLALGYQRDPAVKTYHRDWVRPSDGSRSSSGAAAETATKGKRKRQSQSVSGGADDVPSLQATAFTVAMFKNAKDGYWSTCKNKLYAHRELTESMMLPTTLCARLPPTVDADPQQSFINVRHSAMVNSAGCLNPSEIYMPEQLIFNYNVLIKEGLITSLTTEAKMKLQLAQFYQCVCQKEPKALFTLGKEFIPTAKEITDLRQSILERKKKELQLEAVEIAKKKLVSFWQIEPENVPGQSGYDRLRRDSSQRDYVEFIDGLFRVESWPLLGVDPNFRPKGKDRLEQIAKEYHF
jgi:hypothetical protein